MHIFSTILYNCSAKPVIVASSFELSSFGFFKRGTVKEFLAFASREVCSRTTPGLKQSIKHHMDTEEVENKDFMCHCMVTLKKIGIVIITDGDYPVRVAYDYMNKIVDAASSAHGDAIFRITSDSSLSVPGMDATMAKYQEPKEVDNIAKLQKDIAETKDILIQTMDKLMSRGEKIEELMQKSQDLSFHSKAFMKQSKQLNKCCTII